MKKSRAFVVGLLLAVAVGGIPHLRGHLWPQEARASGAIVVPFPKSARVVRLGDSITAGDNTVGGAVAYDGPLIASINAHYIAAGNGTDAGSPIYYPSGTNGDAIATMTAAVATRVCKYRANVVIIEAGTNDASNARTGAQILADAAALIAAVRACNPAPTAIYWVGPAVIGDRWPSGANTGFGFDANLDTAAANIKTACTNDGAVQYIDLRAAYMAAGPTLNPTNVSGGSGLFVDTVADGSLKHPTAAGGTWMSGIVFSQMTFN
jgi:lysophospholipase L1-like esterase